MKIVQPFVFRKYLDYATLGAMAAFTREVRREWRGATLAEHVKLGPGGIREIEFVAQALQLVRAARSALDAAANARGLLAVLSKKNLLPEQAARELADAYVFLRNVEHRLQYLDDAQRHDLPGDEEDRARLAKMAGFASWQAFSARLQSVRDAGLRAISRACFAERDPEAAPWPEHPRLDALRSSQRYAALPADSRRRLDALVAGAREGSRATADPQATLARGVDLVEAIASRAAYLALLAENPEALERVTADHRRPRAGRPSS